MDTPETAPREAPGPDMRFGLGLALQRDMLGLIERNAHYGGLVKLGKLGATTVFVVSDPALVGEMMQSRWRDFDRGERMVEAAKPVFSYDNLLLAKHEQWLDMRRIIQPALARERLLDLVPTIVAEVERLSARWRTLAPLVVDMSQEMGRLAQKAIIHATFGGSIGQSLDTLMRSWDGINHYIVARTVSPVVLPPSFPLPFHRRMQRANAILRDLVATLISQRRAELADGRQPSDLVDLLLTARDPETGEGLPENQLHEQILMIFFSGFETTAVLMTWTWLELARNPEVAAKLQAEVDAVLADRTPTREDLPKLVYTRQVLEESMRLRPPGYMIARSPIGEQQLGGYRIPARSIVFASPWLIHHDPRWWPDPLRFDPDRFAPERRAELPANVFMPFGAGPRICAGRHMAMLEATLTLATLTRHFRAELVPGERYQPDTLLSLHIKGGAKMRIVRRE